MKCVISYGNNRNVLNVPFKMLATSDDFVDLHVGDRLSIPGYPQWHDKLENRPIMRKGTIASDPRTNYSYENTKGDCLLYESFSSEGASGSPVFADKRGIMLGPLPVGNPRDSKLIGVNAGHLNESGLSHAPVGLSYLYKSVSIIELIEHILKDG